MMRRNSFSLIEVSTALLIVGLVIGGMLMIFGQGFYFANTTKKKVVAYNLAQEILEKYFDWEELDELDGNNDDTVTNDSYTNPPDPVTINNVTYTPRLTISDGPVSSLCDELKDKLKRIEVTVSWDGGNFTLVCLKAHY